VGPIRSAVVALPVDMHESADTHGRQPERLGDVPAYWSISRRGRERASCGSFRKCRAGLDGDRWQREACLPCRRGRQDCLTDGKSHKSSADAKYSNIHGDTLDSVSTVVTRNRLDLEQVLSMESIDYRRRELTRLDADTWQDRPRTRWTCCRPVCNRLL
jgi:hypothetical protein